MKRFDLGTLGEAEAEKLLLDIAPRIGEHAGRLAKLCGYLPLALRVSANVLANDKTQPVAYYLEQLEAERLRQLDNPETPNDPDTSVEASLALSYISLPTDIQMIFAQLGVFASTFTLDAAQQVIVITSDSSSIDDALGLLRARSLLAYDAISERYELQNTVRAFALERLGEQESEHFTLLRHAQYYIQLASRAEALYRQGDQLQGLALFDLERRQIDAVWQWLLSKAADDTVGIRQKDELILFLADATANLGELRYDVQRERLPQLEEYLIAAKRLQNRKAEGSALGNIGLVYSSLGNHRQAITYYEQNLMIAREVSDRQGEGSALNNLGLAHDSLGATRQAVECYEQALAISREIGDRRGEGNNLSNLGNAYFSTDEYERAIAFYEQALAISREIGDRRGEGNNLGNLGNAYNYLGEYQRAIAFYEQALAISREIGDRRGEGNNLGNLGNAYNYLGEYQRAIAFYEQALAISREIGDRRGEGNNLGNLGLAYNNLENYAQAIEYHEQQLAIAREIGDRRSEGVALGNLGNVYRDIKEYERAIDYYEQCIAVFNQIGDVASRALNSWNLGVLYETRGELDKALELMQIYADFLHQIGHTDAEKSAERLAQIRAQLSRQTTSSSPKQSLYIEPLELARQALMVLSPFVAQGALAKIGEDTTDRVTQLVGRVWNFLQSIAQGNPKAEAALEVYQEEPDDELNMKRLAKLLAEHLQHYQAVVELREAVGQLQKQSSSSSVHPTVTVHRDNYGQQAGINYGTMTQSNQTINDQASNKGAQGIFQGPVTFNQQRDGDITARQSSYNESTITTIITALVGLYTAYMTYKASVAQSQSKGEPAPEPTDEPKKGEQVAHVVESGIQQHGSNNEQLALRGFAQNPEMFTPVLEQALINLAKREPTFAQQLLHVAKQANVA
jgi:tetratricopeptide (TPR) repeat protein